MTVRKLQWQIIVYEKKLELREMLNILFVGQGVLKIYKNYIYNVLTFDKLYLNINKRFQLKIQKMAVPKKRISKSKKNTRKANWKRKGSQAAERSLSLAKSMLQGKTTSFVYSENVKDE